jgi:hypothetical protein
MEQQQRITCPQCGKSGPYRPEMAGKKLRCKCGNVIQVPAGGPTPVARQALEDEPIRLEPIAPARKPKAAPVEDGDEYDMKEPEPELNRSVQRPADVVAYRSAPAEEEKPAPAAPTYPTFMRPKTYTADNTEEQSQLIKIVIILAIVVSVVGGAVFAIKYFGGSHSAAATGATQLGEDADIQEKMQDEYYKEVHAWFQEDGTRIMGPWSQQQALSQADRWKDMGAKNVYAFGTRMSMVAVIELPDDAASRKKLFEWQASWHREHFEKVWSDMGQKYLMIRLGI